MYEKFASSITSKQWQKIGTSRRSGVATPLFCLFSKNSTGIGEIPDLKLLIDWCQSVNMSIIQLLPLNDVGFEFRPYDSQSTIALDPIYLSLTEIQGVSAKKYAKPIQDLKKKFPINRARVNYEIKKAKLALLNEMFKNSDCETNKNFKSFVNQNRFWLDDYSMFKVIQTYQNGAGWEFWPEDFKTRLRGVMDLFRAEHQKEIEFQKWLQWQLFTQFKEVKEYANQKKVYLMGDLPFLVSRNSADVWAHQDYFKLHLVAGAPPDPYFSKGQRWGMPPYNWGKIESQNYDYLISKLHYAAEFYDMYRIDHLVGIFRLWTIKQEEPLENHGFNGVFDPQDENVWEQHGRKLLSVMIQNADMLPCAEDLGVVPKCSPIVLEEFGIPGMDIQRWARDWEKTFDFKEPSEFRQNSISTVATHDMPNFCGWWQHEAGTVDAELFERKTREKGIDFKALEPELFDLSQSQFGRLRWRKDLNTLDKFLWAMKRSRNEVWDLADMYLGTFDEQEHFLKFVGLPDHSLTESSPKLVERALERINESASIFSIQLLQDWLALDGLKGIDHWAFRINFPGTVSDQNWSIQMPVSLEEMLKLSINEKIRMINQKTNRI